MRWALASDVGRVRERNEDAYATFEVPAPVGGRGFVVADGLGGHPAGDVASRLAVEVVRDGVVAWARRQRSAPDLPAARRALVGAVRRAHRALRAAAGRDPTLAGMGTTLTAAWVIGRAFVYAHVGDSRLYRFGPEGIQLLTRDHALLADMVRQGRLTEEQARVHPHRHVLTQALGLGTRLQVDAGQGELAPGEGLVLCTDGLTAVVRDEELAEVIRLLPPEEAVPRLIQLANQRGGPDNVTLAVVRISARHEDATAAAGAARGGGA